MNDNEMLEKIANLKPELRKKMMGAVMDGNINPEMIESIKAEIKADADKEKAELLKTLVTAHALAVDKLHILGNLWNVVEQVNKSRDDLLAFGKKYDETYFVLTQPDVDRLTARAINGDVEIIDPTVRKIESYA